MSEKVIEMSTQPGNGAAAGTDHKTRTVDINLGRIVRRVFTGRQAPRSPSFPSACEGVRIGARPSVVITTAVFAESYY